MSNYTDAESSFDLGQPIFLYHFFGETIGHWRFTSDINSFDLQDNSGVSVGVYDPWPIKHGDTTLSMTPDRKSVEVTLAAGSSLDRIYTTYPPTENLNVVIRRTHNRSFAWQLNAPVVWMGRAIGIEFNGSSEVQITCEPSITAGKRPGLRRNYTLHCPHLLYGPECKADKAAATVTRTVSSYNGDRIILNNDVDASKFKGGSISWTNGHGYRETLTIREVLNAGTGVYYQGTIRDLPPGTTVTLVYGCDHTMSICDNVFNNVNNFGGFPFIPLDNPATANASIFY